MGSPNRTCTRAGLPRGFLRLWPREQHHSLLFTLSVQGDWRPAQQFAQDGASTAALDALDRLGDSATAAQVVTAVAAAAPLESVVDMTQVHTTLSLLVLSAHASGCTSATLTTFLVSYSQSQ